MSSEPADEADQGGWSVGSWAAVVVSSLLVCYVLIPGFIVGLITSLVRESPHEDPPDWLMIVFRPIIFLMEHVKLFRDFYNWQFDLIT